MRIDLYSKGYALIHKPVCVSKSGGGKRGRLTGKVSKASFRRFRSWCIRHDISGDCWGITLTVPGLDLISIDDFKSLHHKLCVFCNDRSIPCIWRVELQRRGQPHLHIVAFCTPQNAIRIMSHWYKLLDGCPAVYSREFVSGEINDLVVVSRSYLNGSSHAVDLQFLKGDFRAFRYLVAHMSKRKVDQLGFAGRNWGVCNKRLFHDVDPISYDLDDKSFYKVRRWVRRLTRSRAFRGKAYILGDPSVVRRMIDFASGLSTIPF